MTSARFARSSASLLPALAAVAFAACGDSHKNTGDDDGSGAVDAGVTPDAPPTSICDPTTVLPSGYRPIDKLSAGLVTVTTTGGVTSGTIDATAGGITMSADNPYIYVDLKNGVRVDATDVAARTSTAWDLAIKRSSFHVNGGDAGAGNRKLAVVQAATLAEVTVAPTTGYATDDFTDADCKLVTTEGGEPESGFGEWYSYDDVSHTLSPKPEVYVIERNNGSHTAFRITSYYDTTKTPKVSAFYSVEWKQL